VSSSYAKERALDRIVEVSGQGHDLVTLWQETTEVLRSAIPHYMSPCYFTLDPASLLITSHYQRELPEFPPEFFEAEYFEDDVHKLADLAQRDRAVSTLHEVTGGDPSSSPRWQRNMEMGGDQEMIAVLRTEAGDVWGMLGIYREPERPMFDRDEIGLLAAVAPHLAHGTRTGLLVGEASDPEGPDAPGLLVLSEGGDVESATPGVDRWLADFPDGDIDAGRLPSAVRSVAYRAQRGAENPDAPAEVAIARVLTGSGTWVVLHGTSLIAAGSKRTAVIVEPAHPARITPLLMSAYGLTEREQEVTRLVLQGDSTQQAAERLVVSPHTIQQHLKSIFEKTGVRSRRDLVGKVFFSHYEPRVRDNESRVPVEKPLRGGPMPAGD
jgi:DNA-binding CsgD family transcriptional regulator